MSKRDQVLILNPPSEIKFKGPYTEFVTRTLTLTNPSQQKVAFKIKTTTPKRYCVRPNSGMLTQGETVSVSIMLQPYNQENDKTKHKFMVQSIFLEDNLLEGPLDNYWKKANPETLMDTKLKCVFEEDDSPKKTTTAKQLGGTGDLEVSATKSEISLQSPTNDQVRLWEEIQELKNENERLKKEGLRYRNLALDQSFLSAPKLSEQEMKRGGEDGMLKYRKIAVMVIMVLIGILIGKILF